ncbi:hypothetical protein T492DRAFT_1126676 [Pavlovales sp. CCMP2436]|nr:hypothetical protein T492DRAFT_1126676 [Pavlovales sp. CCMP2436]
MPISFKEIITTDGHVHLPKSAIEAYFVAHPDIKAKLKGTDANEAVAARETFLAYLTLHGAPSTRPPPRRSPSMHHPQQAERRAALHGSKSLGRSASLLEVVAHHSTSILPRLVVGVDKGVHPVDRLRVSALPDPEVRLDAAKHALQVLRHEELFVVVKDDGAEVLDPGWHRALAWLR